MEPHVMVMTAENHPTSIPTRLGFHVEFRAVRCRHVYAYGCITARVTTSVFDR